ncbi:MAG: hypothetical protein QGM50_02070 [Anaerolineae bacterium]|nr:hypothetical protein [Anaerolineae bacterium]MDK1081237.1 hypothetical protein [Anaerolineae bacterium]MDK1117556.1 hypothetical protein [Anaerolineae bacterium]
MNCYYHPKKPAVGVCKYCQRGLCSESLAEVDDSLACKDRHEKQVREINYLEKHNLLRAGRFSSAFIKNAVFYALVGLLFTGFGAYQMRFLGLQAIFLLAIGLFLLYAAIVNYLESKKY